MTDEYAATRALLVAELDAARFGHPGYLAWFYGANPRGRAIEEQVDDPETGRRVGHYAVLPARFRTPAGAGAFIFSSNVATDSSQRRGGLFRDMAQRMYERAAATGAPAMVGVGNHNSTVVVVERFGWTSLGPLPVRVGMPLAGRRAARRVESITVDDDFLASDRFAALASNLDWVPVRDWVQSWDAAFLRWRLSRPDGGYVLHVGRDALAVSVAATAPLGIRAAVVLKVFPRPGAVLPVRTGALLAAACRHHRAPLYVYAGFNAHAVVRGLRPPRRLQPSPLNLVVKPLDESVVRGADFRLDTFEFLDMDAY